MTPPLKITSLLIVCLLGLLYFTLTPTHIPLNGSVSSPDYPIMASDAGIVHIVLFSFKSGTDAAAIKDVSIDLDWHSFTRAG
jgi:hypothetical protein